MLNKNLESNINKNLEKNIEEVLECKVENRDQINSRIQKRAILLDGSGREYRVENPEEFSEGCSKYPIMRKFLEEELGSSSPGKESPSIQAMQKLELVDYEKASDSGHFRFYPKGALIFDLIKQWAEEIAMERLECLKIETPLIYDYNEPDIREQVQSFHERHYMVNAPGKERDFILRFAGDFGLFRMLKDAKLSYKNLPLRIYEYSKSFRYEKSGELAGLKRLRGFSMPDIHSFSSSLEDGFREYKELYKAYYDLARSMGVKFAVVFRAVENFYYEHKWEIIELAQYGEGPIYIELLSEMKHYWAIKSEFQAIDVNDGFMQLSTVQLDVKDAAIYGINFMDSDGQKKGCIICHSSIGSIERWMYAILESSMMKEKSELPYWLSPIQVRILPVSSEYVDLGVAMAKLLSSWNVRAEVDDREERLGKKIRNAEQQWIPFCIVVGEKEAKEQRYFLRGRNEREVINNGDLSIEEAGELLRGLQNGMPYEKLNLNIQMSKHPIFRG